jgi:hypothetical protein
MIRSTIRRIVKWAMDDPNQFNFANKLTISTSGIEAGPVRGDEEDRVIRRPGMVFTVFPAEGGTVIQCRSNNYGENHNHIKTAAIPQPRLYVIHDDATFNDELANIIHMERVRAL